jgi:hypothetical protein
MVRLQAVDIRVRILAQAVVFVPVLKAARCLSTEDCRSVASITVVSLLNTLK